MNKVFGIKAIASIFSVSEESIKKAVDESIGKINKVKYRAIHNEWLHSKIPGGCMNKNIKQISVVCLCLLLSGCSMFQSALNDIKGNLIGNGYTIYTYDNYGSEVMETSGDKISITGNAVENTSYDENGRYGIINRPPRK